MSIKRKTSDQPRVAILDILRGVSILLMVVYHFAIDLYYVGRLSADLMFHPVVNFLQVFFACLFILISGIACRFSRHNAKRGLLLFAAGLVVTLVTYLFDRNNPVLFGILHFLGVSALLFAALRPLIDRLIPLAIQPVLYLAGAVFTWGIPYRFYNVSYLWPLGFRPWGFVSADYFPLLPYFFVYLFGTWLGVFVAGGKMPGWFYWIRCPFLEKVGRNTLWIYALHQPILMGLVLALDRWILA